MTLQDSQINKTETLTMKADPKEILNQAAHDTGMTVPEGYFEKFQQKMIAELPEIAFEQTGKPIIMEHSWWKRVRPYVYMAAMFAGIWCMMKMFDIIKPTADLSIDAHPAVASAINNDEFFNNYIAPSFDQSELYDELYDEGFDTTQFDDEQP